MMKWNGKSGLLLGLVVLGLCACQPVSDAWVTGWTERAAHDQIMLVRENPPSLGQRRLQSQSVVYPDLGVFLQARGSPDFLAETTTHDRHFLILYYLKAKCAYACRAKAASTRQIEFTGPYPITRREVRLLRNFKQQAAGRLANPVVRASKPLPSLARLRLRPKRQDLKTARLSSPNAQEQKTRPNDSNFGFSRTLETFVARSGGE